MAPAKGFFGKIAERSVWNSENLADIPERYWGLYKWVTPIKLGLFAFFGLVGTEARIPAIDDTFGVGYGDFWTVFLALSAVAALVFSAFYPIAKRLEMSAIVIMTILMGIYAIAVLYQALVLQDVNRGAFGVAVMIFLVFPTWIVVDLLYEVRPKEEVANKP